MDKCSNCTMLNSSGQCFVQIQGCTWQCDLIDPNNKRYMPGYIKSHRVFNGLDSPVPFPSGNLEVSKMEPPIVTSSPQEMPGLLTKAKNFGKAMVNYVTKGGFVVPNEIAENRLKICEACEHYKENRCSLCGCYCTLKVKMSTEKCPINKWSEYNTLLEENEKVSNCLPCSEGE